MRDEDGGLSLISGGIRAVTKADEKQDQLQQEIPEVQNRLLHLSPRLGRRSRHQHRSPEAHRAAEKVLDWLAADQSLVYHRVHALQRSMCLANGDQWQLADCLETQSRRYGDPLPRTLRGFLHDWATVAAPKRWEEHCRSRQDGEPWLDPGEMGIFTRYLGDYLFTDMVFARPIERLLPVVGLKTNDEAARRRARRNYVRIILNDHIMNPGPGRRRRLPRSRARNRRAKRPGEQADDLARPDGPALAPLAQSASRRPGPRRRRARQAPAGQRGIDRRLGAV